MSEACPRRILLIQHSHTDVGYTATGEQVAAWQPAFIREAMRLAGDPDGDDTGFRWTCESFWGVEQFLDECDPEEAESFVGLVRSGRISLSASWLNLNELADLRLHRDLVSRSTAWAAARQMRLRCAMTADVNGNGQGFGIALAEAGVETLFTCVHSHHGFPPLRRQQPFWWELPGGGRLLVHVGEHYHLGNELGLAPAAVSSYLIKDDCTAQDVYHDSWKVACRRIPRYLEQLRMSGVDVIDLPVMISGLRTDNGPPSSLILEQVERWNREHGDLVEIRLASLEEAAAALHAQADNWPVHAGDWPDWWSDGPASRPMMVRGFRRAQRERELGDRLVQHAGGVPSCDDKLVDVLGLYAEHTFSHAASIHQPWHEDVQRIAAAKDALVARALEMTGRRILRARAALGETVPSPGRPARWRVHNPWPHQLAGPVLLRVEHYELHEAGLDAEQELRQLAPDRTLPVQRIREGFLCWLELEAGACTDLELLPASRQPVSLDPGMRTGSDGVADLLQEGTDRELLLGTAHLRIEGTRARGITAMCDGAGRSLLDPGQAEAPFALIHELSPCRVPEDVASSRAAMGRNRKSSRVLRGVSRLLDTGSTVHGPVQDRLTLPLELSTCSWAELVLIAWHAAPRLDVELRLHKQSRWEAESLYLALPFGSGDLWLDRPGVPVRHAVDQLPGTLLDFSSLQAGFTRVDTDSWLAISMPDQHLLQTGPLEHGPRQLMPPRTGWAVHTRAWLLNNIWETNFAAECGGFHSWRWMLQWGASALDISGIPALCGRPLKDFVVIREGDAAV